MDKYLVKPTEFVGVEGTVYSAENLDQTPAIQEINKKISNIVLDAAAIKEVRDRVYNLEIVNGAINDRIEVAEEVSNEAKTKANAAHSIASGLQEAVGNAESTAVKAQAKATEAHNQLSSISADYENLKGRIEDLEEIGGQGGTNLVVGKSKMGYIPDFTEYGLNGKNHVYIEYGDEGRSLTYDADTPLGDVIEELMYVTATGLTNHNNRINALENGSPSSGSSGNTSSGTSSCNCPSDVSARLIDLENKQDELKNEITLFDYAIVDYDGKYQYTESEYNSLRSIPDIVTNLRDTINNHKLMDEHILSRLTATENKNTSQDNTLTSHGNSIQSLDTRTGSHTASIGQLENRMTDVDNYSKANRTMITGVATALSNIEVEVESLKNNGSSCSCPTDVSTRLSTLETITGSNNTTNEITLIKHYISQCNSSIKDLEDDVETLKNNGSSGGTSSGESITYIGDLNIKSDGSEYTYDIVEKYNGSETTTTTYTFATLIGGLDQLLSNINVLSSRLERTENQILSMSRLLLEIKTKLGM